MPPYRWGIVAAILVAAALVTSYFVVLPLFHHSAGGGPSRTSCCVGSVFGSPQNLTVLPSALAGPIPSSYFGVDLRVEYPPTGSPGVNLSGTPIHWVRWPGGDVGERLDALNDRIYNENGSITSDPTTLTAFVSWCKSVGCGAIIQLPTEIDDPSYAASEVQYIAQQLDFTPEYYELGNEPALWTHFEIPWADWNASQEVNATPSAYAEVVVQYVQEIHAVDPSARILGLGGLGTGAYGETTWIRAIAEAAGTEVAGYSVHVYPAGGTTNATASLGAFFDSLTDASSISSRIPPDRAALASACPSCADEPFLVTELGSGNAGGPYDGLMASYAEVPYIAALLIQGLEQNVTNTDLFAYESTYNGSFYTPPSSAPHPVELLYADLLPLLGEERVVVSPSAVVPGFYTVATTGGPGGALTVLAVNAGNTTLELSCSPRADTGLPSSRSTGPRTRRRPPRSCRPRARTTCCRWRRRRSTSSSSRRPRPRSLPSRRPPRRARPAPPESSPTSRRRSRGSRCRGSPGSSGSGGRPRRAPRSRAPPGSSR